MTSLVVVFLAVAAIVFLLHQSPHAASNTTSATTGPAHVVSSPATVSRAETARMLRATRSAGSATTTARNNLDALTGFPTPAKVAAVMVPYVSALQAYETVLTDTDTPPAARTAALSVLIQVTRDVQLLKSIYGLAPVRLGSYLEDFGTNASQLLRTLSTFDRKLHVSPR